MPAATLVFPNTPLPHIAAEASLEPDGLVGAWRFYDAQVPFVERLVVENAIDAGADLSVKDNNGGNALSEAVILGNIENELCKAADRMDEERMIARGDAWERSERR